MKSAAPDNNNTLLEYQDPMRVLSALLVQDPKRELGFFQNSAEIGGVFQPEKTTIGFDPLRSFVVRGQADPFELLKAQDETTMGYIAYDSVRFREPMLNRAQGGFSTIPADFTSAQFSVFGKLLVFDHHRKELTLTCREGDFDIESLLKSAPESATEGPSESNSESNDSLFEMQPDEFQRSLGREAFVAGVKKLKEHIMAGDIFQAVLAERFETTLTVSAFEIFKTLIDIGSSAYQFYYATPERTVFGASPELLLGVCDGILETHPIAGTRPRGKTEAEELRNQEDLLKDTKENAEHLMLVDLARNDLGRISTPGSVRVSERNLVKKFPSVMHLVSKVVGQLDQKSAPIDALASCFPAGTLSGAPKIRAMQLISEIERHPRGFYGGAFFLNQRSHLEACISIRSMEVIDNQGYIQAGAGIVMDSDPESEYEEVLHKTRTLRRALALTLKRKGKP